MQEVSDCRNRGAFIDGYDLAAHYVFGAKSMAFQVVAQPGARCPAFFKHIEPPGATLSILRWRAPHQIALANHPYGRPESITGTALVLVLEKDPCDFAHAKNAAEHSRPCVNGGSYEGINRQG